MSQLWRILALTDQVVAGDARLPSTLSISAGEPAKPGEHDLWVDLSTFQLKVYIIMSIDEAGVEHGTWTLIS